MEISQKEVESNSTNKREGESVYAEAKIALKKIGSGKRPLPRSSF